MALPIFSQKASPVLRLLSSSHTLKPRRPIDWAKSLTNLSLSKWECDMNSEGSCRFFVDSAILRSAACDSLALGRLLAVAEHICFNKSNSGVGGPCLFSLCIGSNSLTNFENGFSEENCGSIGSAAVT